MVLLRTPGAAWPAARHLAGILAAEAGVPGDALFQAATLDDGMAAIPRNLQRTRKTRIAHG
jgi:hypothetical protein